MLRARHKLLFPGLLGSARGYLLNENLLLASQYEPGGWLYDNHSRASTATRTNSSGLIESVAIDVPRRQHDSAGNPLGYLHEPQATNLHPYIDLSDYIATGVSRTLNAATSPSGQTDASEINLTTGAAATSFQRNTVGLTASADKTLSVFFKKPPSDAASYFTLGFCQSAAAYAGIQIDLSGSPSVIQTGAGSFTLVAYSLEEFANDWWRVSVTANIGAGTIAYPTMYPSNAAWDGASDLRQNLTGTSTDKLWMWGPQFEDNASRPTSLIPTSGLPATRQADTAEIDVPAASDGFAYVTYGDGEETTFAVTPGGTWALPTDLDDTYARIIFKR